jgi:hypothetical protein
VGIDPPAEEENQTVNQSQDERIQTRRAHVQAKIADWGSISHGTLRLEDLACSFVSTLNAIANALDPDDPWGDSINKLNAEHDDVEDEYLDEFVGECADMLNEVAPEGFYFGAIEGDGSDFGFWPIDSDDN